MRAIRHILVLATLLTTQQVFAHDMDMSMDTNNKACANIANACLAAGFDRKDAPSKRFWQDCMKPVLMGQAVKGITIDSTMATSCRATKIEELKAELSDLQKVGN